MGRNNAHNSHEAGRLLATSPRTVLWLIARGELATVGQGQIKRVPYDAIVTYLNRHRNEAN